LNKFIQSLESREFSREFEYSEFLNANLNRNDAYRYFQKCFRAWSPKWLRDHRYFFSTNGRGFGEDAFHAAWFLLLREFKPKNLLEIGVFRGQTISLWTLIGEKIGTTQRVIGISPLDSSGDAVSNYQQLDYLLDINSNFSHFSLTSPNVIKAFSTDPNALEIIKNGKWDLIYIDGSHEYEVVKSDLIAATQGLNPGGILVLDDSSLFTDFKLKTSEAFRGHPGPSRVFEEIDYSVFEFLFGVGHNNVLRKRLLV
jgi:hypothetical protein